MADNSLDIIEPFDNHPCDTPRGCTYYDTRFLSDCQQLKLNQLKLATIKSAERYLQRNPEIRGFVALITRHVFRQQPRRDIPKLIKEYFRRPREAIEAELEEYLQTRPPAEPEELCVDEETIYSPEDFDKYLEAMAPCVEEAPTPKMEPEPKDPSAFIREMLVEHVKILPCFDQASEPREHHAHREHVHRNERHSQWQDMTRSKSRRGVSILQVSGSERSMMRKLVQDLRERGQIPIEDDMNSYMKRVSDITGTLEGDEGDEDVENEVEDTEEPTAVDEVDVEMVEGVAAQGEENEDEDEHEMEVEG